MMRLGHYRPVHVKSKASQLLRTTLIARKKFVDHMLAIEDTIRGLMKVHGLKLGAVHRSRFAAKVEMLLADAPICERLSSHCSKFGTRCEAKGALMIGNCRGLLARMMSANG